MIMPLWTLLIKNISLDTVIIAVVGYVIVFASLVLLFWFFNTLPKLMKIRLKRQRSRAGETPPLNDEGISGETIAAISAGLHLYLSELHDEESGVLTIKKVSKAYSPWSSKIYAVRNQFNRI